MCYNLHGGSRGGVDMATTKVIVIQRSRCGVKDTHPYIAQPHIHKYTRTHTHRYTQRSSYTLLHSRNILQHKVCNALIYGQICVTLTSVESTQGRHDVSPFEQRIIVNTFSRHFAILSILIIRLHPNREPTFLESDKSIWPSQTCIHICISFTPLLILLSQRRISYLAPCLRDLLPSQIVCFF